MTKAEKLQQLDKLLMELKDCILIEDEDGNRHEIFRTIVIGTKTNDPGIVIHTT